MRTYALHKKEIPGFGVFGGWAETKVRVSTGRIDGASAYTGEPLHYHKEGIVYFLVQEGSGVLEIEEVEVELTPGLLYEIQPGEKYRIRDACAVPFSWIAICTVNSPEDKVTC